MSYLVSSNLDELLAGRFASTRELRLAGGARRRDCGYYDIVRFIGERAISPKDISIKYTADEFTVSDPEIDAFAEDVQIRLRLEGRLHDGPPVMKLHAASFGKAPSITVGPVSYGLQAATCFALDLPHELFDNFGGSLRNYVYAKYDMLSVASNPLAICLGVCGMLIVREETKKYLLQVTRAGHLTSLEGTVGPSAAGVVEYIEGLANVQELIDRAMGEEVREELGLAAGEYSIVPLAWGMEIFRGHRPQLLCAITTPLDRKAVAQRLERVTAEAREFSEYRFVPIEAGTIGDDDFAVLNPEARANWLLVEDWLG